MNYYVNDENTFINILCIVVCMNFPKLIVYFLLLVILCSFSGCTEKNQYSNDLNTASVNSDDQNTDLNDEVYNATLKKTAILSLDNGYSAKILEIDRKEGFIRVSFRKDEQEYTTKTMLLGQSYEIKDQNSQNTVYSIHVDRILDNSFMVELSYILKPAIYQEVIPIKTAPQNEVKTKIDMESVTRTYIWSYDDYRFSMECEYDKDAYKLYSQRSRDREYSQFVTDPYDDEFISQITEQLEDLAHDSDLREEEIPYVTMMFVQSLPYISDSVSSGYDEYPRFPFETLYEGGGDCEDSSILLASLLYDMGYGVALIELPGHMAVGVKGNNGLSGSYYEYAGIKYYYLETTNSGWDVGVIPDEFAEAQAKIVPIYGVYPELSLEFTGDTLSDGYQTYVNLDIKLENLGSANAEDVVIYTALETSTEGRVWDQIQSDTISSVDAEGGMDYSVSNLKVPAGERYRVRITSWGTNANMVEVYSDWVVA